ncbi:hypothetical protein D9M72_330130 [compost metagenome]
MTGKSAADARGLSALTDLVQGVGLFNGELGGTAGGSDEVRLVAIGRLNARLVHLPGAHAFQDLLDIGNAGTRLQQLVGFLGRKHFGGIDRRGRLDELSGLLLLVHRLGPLSGEAPGQAGKQAGAGCSGRFAHIFDFNGRDLLVIGKRRCRLVRLGDHSLIFGLQRTDVALQVLVAVVEIVAAEGIVEFRLCGRRHLRGFAQHRRLSPCRHCRLAIFDALELVGDMHEGLVQCLEGARRALLAGAAEVLERAKVFGKRRDCGQISAGTPRRAVLGIGFHHRFGRLASGLDDVFVAGREVVLERAHAVFEIDGHRARSDVRARLADQRRQIGDLRFEVLQGDTIIERCSVGLFQTLRDADQAIFQPVETRVGGRLNAMGVEFVDPACQIVEPLGQCVVDAALVQGLDLARNIRQIIVEIRLRGPVAALHHQRKLVETLFETGGRLFAGEIFDPGGQGFQAGAEAGIVRARQAVDLTGQVAKPAFQPVDEATVETRRRATVGSDRAADFIEPTVEIRKLRNETAVIGLDLAAQHFDGLGDGDQFVLKRVDGRAALQRADLRLDLVQAIGQRHQLVVAVLIKRDQPILDAGPAVFHAAHAVFTRKAVDHRTQFVEVATQRVGLGGRGLAAELLDAVGKTLHVTAHVFGEAVILRLGLDAANFGTQ